MTAGASGKVSDPTKRLDIYSLLSLACKGSGDIVHYRRKVTQDPESSKEGEGETALKKTRWTKRENLLAKAVLLRSRYEKMGVPENLLVACVESADHPREAQIGARESSRTKIYKWVYKPLSGGQWSIKNPCLSKIRF